MNTFFKTFLACLLAIVVHGVVSFFLIMFIFLGITSLFAAPDTYKMQDGSILVIDLGREMPDSPVVNPLDNFDYSTLKIKHTISLYEVVSLIDAAAGDPRIKGIYLNIPSETPSSLSSLYELRQALEQFRKSDKFVIAFGDGYSKKCYYLASCADKIYLNPVGSMEWAGMSSNVMFYKGLFDKLGIEPQIIRHGKFKGAVEPFMLDKLSPENRLQTQEMLNSLWGYLVEQVGKSRSIETTLLEKYASESGLISSADALKFKMVDELRYTDQVYDHLSELTGQEEPRFVSLGQYRLANGVSMGNALSDNQIAVVYANGDIVDSGDSRKEIVGNELAAELRRVRKDDKVKAVVLRVNSPGGSAIASDVIWREVSETRKVKPVIVSMGTYAASGGYYISCSADEIVATPATITGSIGVFGLMFNVEKAAREKLGITVDVVKTNPMADMGNMFRSLSPTERVIMQNHIDSTYHTFVGVVAAGREMKFASVDSIAQGRVWSGLQALNNGLADKIGSLQDAIAIAAAKASLSDYRIKCYPESNESLFAIFNSLTQVTVKYLKTSVGLVPEVDRVKEAVDKYQGVWAKIPYQIEIQ